MDQAIERAADKLSQLIRQYEDRIRLLPYVDHSIRMEIDLPVKQMTSPVLGYGKAVGHDAVAGFKLWDKNEDRPTFMLLRNVSIERRVVVAKFVPFLYERIVDASGNFTAEDVQDAIEALKEGLKDA